MTDAATIQMKPMQAEDIERVLEICARLPEAPQWTEWQWRQMLTGREVQRIALVATVNTGESIGKNAGAETGIVAVSVTSLVLEDAELETIAVAGAWQRRGVGRRLLEGLMQRCAEVGARRLMLEVRASNQAAQRLYSIAGFTETGRRPGYYRDPAEDAVRMERWLA